MSDPSPAPPNDPPAPTTPPPAAIATLASPAPPHVEPGFDFARVLRVAVIVAAVVSGFAAAHGLIMTVQHYAKEIPAGAVTRVAPAGAGQQVTLDTGAVVTFPNDILETTGDPIVLRPGTRVQKRAATLTYLVDAQPRGGLLWALRQWLLPARVTLPLAIYLVLSWLLVFRAPHHRRHIAVEALVVPIVRWLAVMLASLVVMALLVGCALGCGGVLSRFAG